MEHALVRGDVAMHDDPLRAQSMALVAGAVVASIAVAGCAVFGLLRPQGSLGSAQIVVVRESGALYVRVDDTWHQAPNLASARLVARSAADPAVVAQRALLDAKRGPAVGIAGAPSSIGEPAEWDSWSVCDGRDTVVVVERGPSRLDGLDPTRSVLVTPRGESAAITYLLYDGRRAAVDLRNTIIRTALRLDGVAPLPISRALLDSVPEVSPITVPSIDGAGSAGPAWLDGAPVGAVVRVARSDGADHYVVLGDGVQRIGEVAADLIRFAYAGGSAVPTVSPATIAAARTVDRLPLADLPTSSRPPIGAGATGVVCARWRSGPNGSRSNSALLVGDTVGDDTVGGDTVELAQADGDGPNVDRIAIPAGRSGFVHASRVAGDDGSSGPRYLITDSGVVHGVRDDEAAAALGLPDQAGAAPWPILARLPRGAELSIDAASVVRDGLAAPP